MVLLLSALTLAIAAAANGQRVGVVGQTIQGSTGQQVIAKDLGPDIFNTDQGAQFTALAFTSRLAATGIRISMDGRGRALDNVFVERLWRSVKYEHVYLHEYETVPQLEKGLGEYFTFYNHERPHQSLSYQTPAEVHFAGLSCPIAA